jgi:hypothetical protein
MKCADEHWLWVAKPSDVLREMLAEDLSCGRAFDVSCYWKEELLVVTTFSALQEEVQHGFLYVDLLRQSLSMCLDIVLAFVGVTKPCASEGVEVELPPPTRVPEWKNRQPTLEVSTCLDMR